MSRQKLNLHSGNLKLAPSSSPNRPIIWLAVHLCSTAAWGSEWWTLLGCRAGVRHRRVKHPQHRQTCTPLPRPLTLPSPNSLGISMRPRPPPLLPLAATEPGKAVVPHPPVPAPQAPQASHMLVSPFPPTQGSRPAQQKPETKPTVCLYCHSSSHPQMNLSISVLIKCFTFPVCFFFLSFF